MQAFTYVQTGSFLHRLNPAVKLVAVLGTTLASTFVLDIWTPAAFVTVTLLGLIFFGGLQPFYLARRLAPFLGVIIGFVFLNALFHRPLGEETVLFTIGPLSVSVEGLQLGAAVGLRVLFLIVASLAFVSTTAPRDFVLSLVQQLRLHYKLAYAVLAAYRFIPIFAEEYRHIRDAAKIRGAGRRVTFLGRIKELRRDAVPLLAGAIRRAERLAIAMDSRAFGAFPTRTYYHRLTVTRRDWYFLAAVFVVYAGIVVVLAVTGLLTGVGKQFA